jgi:hypothetical protein
MMRKWKYWAAAAAVLLTVGAGCGEAVQQDASVQGQLEAPKPEAETGAKVDANVDVDTVVDDAIKQSETDASASMEANGDADVLNNDSSELNAYGQAYVDSDYR